MACPYALDEYSCKAEKTDRLAGDDMTNYMDGEVHVWNGGECPVPSRYAVIIWLRTGEMLSGLAGYIEWHHGGNADTDICRFKVITHSDSPDYHRGFAAGRDAAIAAVGALTPLGDTP